MSRGGEFQAALYPLLLIVGVTLGAVLLRGTLTLANFTLIYILVVLVLAIQRGTRLALAAAISNFLTINFFLINPYYTFIVADPRELLDLIIFLVVAVLGGQLAARAREQASTAQKRAYEQEVLYRLTRSFNQLTAGDKVYDALTEVVKIDLGASVAVILPPGSASTEATETTYALPLRFDDQIYGTLRAVFGAPPDPAKLRLLQACAAQAAMALHRIELDQRARKGQQFEEADRLKTAILRSVSHDLRTPITIIKTSANNLQRLGAVLSAAERAELSVSIEQEADQLDQLVGNLLDMSRLQAGAITLNLEPNSLEEVAGDVAARVFQRTKQERIRLDFPEDFPLIAFDYVLLLQALTNLVDNALRYEPDNQQIHLRGVVQPSEVQVRVTNHGDRIRPEDQAHIMEPFYHGGRGKTGLGLAIAKGIVEAHQGRLWVEQDGGTTFVLALPRGQQEEAHDT